MNHLMIDLETLATTPDAAVVQVAAVFFDLETGETGAAFHGRIEPREDGRNAGAVDLETLAWAKDHGTYPHTAGDPVSTREGLARFTRWLWRWVDAQPEVTMRDLEVWAWGMDFDGPILAAALERAGWGRPWAYYQQHDARTVWWLAMGDERRPTRSHDALEDCYAAVRDLRSALAVLKGKEVPA